SHVVFPCIWICHQGVWPMSLLEVTTLAQASGKASRTDHVPVISSGTTNVIPDWLVRHECTCTFTCHSEHALQVMREFHPGHILLSMEKGGDNELALIREATASGARVVVVGPSDDHDLVKQAGSHGDL